MPTTDRNPQLETMCEGLSAWDGTFAAAEKLRAMARVLPTSKGPPKSLECLYLMEK